MRRTSQAGTVLVELLIAMAVTSLILLGLTSVVFVASNAYVAWAAPIQASQTGPLIAVLAANIQSDTHRLPPCHSQPGPTTLDLCLPDGPCSVRYLSQSGQGGSHFEVVRQRSCNSTSQTTLLRNLSSVTRPTFAIRSCSIDTTRSAVITVDGITFGPGQTPRTLTVIVGAPVTNWSC